MTNKRSNVLLVGFAKDIFGNKEFDTRELRLENFAGINIQFSLSNSTAIILKYDPTNAGALKRQLLKFGTRALDNGLMIIVVYDQIEYGKHVQPIIDSSDVSRKSDIISMCLAFTPDYKVAQKIARHDPGPPLNPELEIRPRGIRLGKTVRLFMKRAFQDCKIIEIIKLREGHSASVYSVYSHREKSPVGPRPLPFFAKADDRDKIEKEYTNYEMFVFNFIPFNLRPQLESTRGIKGNKLSMLVGSFVEKSESLKETVHRGQASEAIYSLFDDTLRGWRMQKHQEKGNIFGAANISFPSPPILEKRLSTASKYGASKTRNELMDILRALPKVKFMSTTIHNDLHADNVRVRKDDAILIDFAMARQGPIMADPVSLEVSIAFGYINEYESWLKMINELYSMDNLKTTPPYWDPDHTKRTLEWLWTAIRQIRLLALPMSVSQFEYATLVAISLLRWSAYKSSYSTIKMRREDERQRDHAYAIGEKLLVEISGY